jgi:multidrug efflux pump subunit AcrA (membrane-fusion protein)
MKTIFKTMFLAGAVVMTAACGNNASKQTEQAAAEVVAADPTVSVAQVFVREVPQEAVYTSTVQAFVKNNIAPQMAGRITKINAEIGDFVKEGQILAEIDKVQLLQAQLQLQNQEVELQRLKSLYEEGGLSQSDYDAIQMQYNVLKTQVENLIENTTLRSPINGVVTARNYDV